MHAHDDTHKADHGMHEHSIPSGQAPRHGGHGAPMPPEQTHSRSDHGDEGGHGADADHSGHEQMFRRRFWVCLVLSIPVLLLSPALQEWLHFSIPAFTTSDWLT